MEYNKSDPAYFINSELLDFNFSELNAKINLTIKVLKKLDFQ